MDWLDEMRYETDINKILPFGNKEIEILQMFDNVFESIAEGKSPAPQAKQAESDVAVSTSKIQHDSEDEIIMSEKKEEKKEERLKATRNTRSFRDGKKERDAQRAKQPRKHWSYRELCGDIDKPTKVYSLDQFSFCKDNAFLTKNDCRKQERNSKNNNSNDKLLSSPSEEDDDSISLDEFSDGAINQSTRKVNRYFNAWKKFKYQRDKLSSFITARIFLITLDEDIIQINEQYIGNKIAASYLQKIDKIFGQFGDKRMTKMNIHSQVISACGSMQNVDGQGYHRSIIGIEYGGHLWGYLFIRYRYNKNISKKRIGQSISVQICARARLFTPANLSRCTDISTDNGIKYLKQLHSNYVESIKDSCKFDESIHHHKIGFVWRHCHCCLGGDLSQLYHMLGIAGTGTNCCVICHATISQIRASPTPEDRCWDTRPSHEQSGSITFLTNNLKKKVENKQKNRNNNNSNKEASTDSTENWYKNTIYFGHNNVALYDFPAFLRSLPNFHVFEGIVARVFYAMLEYVNRGSIETDQSISNLQKAMQEWVKINEEIEDLELILEILNKEKQLFDGQEYLQYEKLQNLLEKKTTKRDDKRTAIDDEIKRRNHQDGKAVSLLCMRLNIREFYGIKNSMRGKCAKNFINNWKLFLPYFIKNKNSQSNSEQKLGNIFTGMMINLEFLVKVMMTKNAEPYSDEVLRAMKEAVIEFDALYKRYMKILAQSENFKRFGFKIHYLYHIWEWCQCTRYSPAWMDDERCEAVNLRLRLYWHILESNPSLVGILKMANSIIRKTVGIRNAGGIEAAKETRNMLRRHNSGTDYYKGHSQKHVPINSKHARLASYATV